MSWLSLTFNCVSEALRGGRVVWWCVKRVNLQTVHHILGLGKTLDHRPIDVSCWVPPDGSCLGAWKKKKQA